MRAAGDLFARHGFEGTRTEEIARRAGVNKAMINYHFGGKLGLYERILFEAFEAAARRLDEILEASGSVPESLRQASRAFADLAAERPEFPSIVIREAISGGRHLSRAMLPSFLGVFGRIRGLLERGMAEGSLRSVDPLMTHLLLVGSLMFFAASEPLRRRLIAEGGVAPSGAPTSGEFAEHVATVLIRGLAADADNVRRAGEETPR